MLVILDSGRNELVKGKEAPNKSFREWELNNDAQYRIKEKLEKSNIKVYLTNQERKNKGDIELAKMTNLANDY